MTVSRDGRAGVHGVPWRLALAHVAALDRFKGIAEGVYIKAARRLQRRRPKD